MPEIVAVVGPREGADLEHVERFCRALYAKQPDTILVSGGAKGVDKMAEATWLACGGVVWSYRARKIAEGEFAIEKWELGVPQPRTFVLSDFPTFADYPSANYFRSWLIASEIAERVVAFYGVSHQRGTEFTVYVAEGHRPNNTYIFRKEDAHAEQE